MNKQHLFSLIVVTFLAGHIACAQTKDPDSTLHVLKTDINAESENAEVCVEFDKPLAPLSSARWASAIHLESDGKNVGLPTLAVAGTSLCLFPLERGTTYHLTLSGLRGANEEKMDESYKTHFVISDRSPALSFTGANGGVNGFDFYDTPLFLRAVNVSHVKMNMYRVSDIQSLVKAWQDRGQTALAPTESAYLARNKGQRVWQDDIFFPVAPNATSEQQISLRDKVPDLAPGLYLIIADAESRDGDKPSSKSLTPMAAAWFTQADFFLHALRDDATVHVFVTPKNPTAPKEDIGVIVFNSKGEHIAEGKVGSDAATVITLPVTADADPISLVGIDDKGGVSFADSDRLPVSKSPMALGSISVSSLFVAPLDEMDVDVSLTDSDTSTFKEASLLRLTQKQGEYATIAVPALTSGHARISFAAPADDELWTMRWQKNNGDLLATQDIRVSDNIDLPRLEVTSQRDIVSSDSVLALTVHAITQSNQPAPLVSGHVTLVWQQRGAETLEWQNYHFGMAEDGAETSVAIGDFVTDLQGDAQLHLMLPALPQTHGLYQAKLLITADADAGVAGAPPIIVPVHPATTVIGIKALTTRARFPQNGIARFSLIGIGEDGKLHDVDSLSYQIYEEGRNFTWFQDEGRWNYKQAAQLRPIGGGSLSIKANGSTLLEWPVTAGNYRLVILDANGKALAQTSFSAGWDSTGAASAPALPLNITVPKNLAPGHEASAHVILPEAAMVTFVVSDGHIRKTIHEYRAKGDNSFVFTPAASWQQHIVVQAIAQTTLPENVIRSAVAETLLTQDKKKSAPIAFAAPTIIVSDPIALALGKGEKGEAAFALVNKGSETENYSYRFTLSPGLKVAGIDKGNVSIAAGQNKILSVAFFATQTGAKEIKLDITGAHMPPISRAWPLSIVAHPNGLTSVLTYAVEERQNLFPGPMKKGASEVIAYVSRHPMDGLAEILSYAVRMQPFTTAQLAYDLEALRLWRDVLAQTGVMSDLAVDAKRRTLFVCLLRHQNSDGGFGLYRGADSTLSDTADALTALGKENSDQTASAKKMAIAYIRQRLANTWVDDKERAARAAAFAALATADAVDIPSLHYFSDTSASLPLSAIAEAHIAAAFKHVHDPNAAAFWIKKMLDENSSPKNIELLNALAETDALSSDDVHAAMAQMKKDLQTNEAVDVSAVAMLLRAIAADNADAGPARFTQRRVSNDMANVGVIRGAGDSLGGYRNDDAALLSVTLLGEETKVLHPSTSITRHIYRLNGVEITSPAHLTHGENYVVELKGAYPASGAPLLVQDTGLHPLGCPLSAKTDILSFLPWLDTQALTSTTTCEFTHHDMNIVLPAQNENGTFKSIYFVRGDGVGIGNLPMPHAYILKNSN